MMVPPLATGIVEMDDVSQGFNNERGLMLSDRGHNSVSSKQVKSPTDFKQAYLKVSDIF